jgi:hypothetical protein
MGDGRSGPSRVGSLALGTPTRQGRRRGGREPRGRSRQENSYLICPHGTRTRERRDTSGPRSGLAIERQMRAFQRTAAPFPAYALSKLIATYMRCIVFIGIARTTSDHTAPCFFSGSRVSLLWRATFTGGAVRCAPAFPRVSRQAGLLFCKHVLTAVVSRCARYDLCPVTQTLTYINLH